MQHVASGIGLKVEEVSQEKVRFYINMSHELRTPLSLILAPLEELVEEKSKFDLQEQQKLSYIYPERAQTAASHQPVARLP